MWAKPSPRSPRGRAIKDILEDARCDILCVTEGHKQILPVGGHVIDAGPDWGCPIKEGRRKVLLWSRRPWTDVDTVGSEDLPGGRFVKGITETASGSSLTVIGVCIPWAGAHVSGGRKPVPMAGPRDLAGGLHESALPAPRGTHGRAGGLQPEDPNQ